MERAEAHPTVASDSSIDLRELLDAIPHIAWVTGPDGVLTYLNARWKEYTGVGSLEEESIAALLHPDDLPSVVEAMQLARRNGAPVHYEVRVRSQLGEYRWHRVSALPVRDPTGDIRYWVGTTTDVHDEYLALHRLREQQEDYRFLLDSNPQIPWTTDASGKLLEFSDRWLRMTGLTREEALSNGWTDVPHPDDLQLMMEAFQRAMAERSSLDVEHRARMADGEYRWMRTRAYPRLDTDGAVLKWFGSTEDIHDRKTAQESLLALNENLERLVRERTQELEEANRRLSLAYENAEAFSYTASHDLRTPLRSIIATADLLMADFGERLPAEAKRMLAEQAGAAKKMSGLISDLLAHAKIGSGTVKREPLDLTALACDLTPAFERRNALVRFEIEEGLRANAEASLVLMILQNLFENAVLYSPDGGVVRFGHRDDTFFVSDEGIGFEMEYAERIFLPFERLHSYDSIPGSGIGLATVKKIVELHGGKIWAQSERNKGSEFFFTLG